MTRSVFFDFRDPINEIGVKHKVGDEHKPFDEPLAI